MPDPQRHDGHGPDVTCRPAGRGLCEPYEGPRGLVGWREALAVAARERRNRRGRRVPPPVVGVRVARREEER